MYDKFKLNFAVISAKETPEITSIAKQVGITVPSESLGVFKSVYAKLEDANKNGIRLDSKAVKENLHTIIGTQVNLNHARAGYTVGSIIWADLNDKNEIEIAFTFFKTVYPEDYEKALKLFDKGNLTVSFEIMSKRETQELHADGTKTLNDIIFDGVGLLLDEKPAYPGAIVFERAKREIRKIIGQDSPDLVFATQIAKDCRSMLDDIEKTIKNKNVKGGIKEMDKKTNEKLMSRYKEGLIAELGDLTKGWTDEDFLNDDKVKEARTPKEKASKESKKVTEKAEAEKAKNDETVIVTDKKSKVTETLSEGEDKIKIESETKRTVDGKPSFSEISDTEIVYTFAQVEEIKEEMKAEYEKKLKEKDEQITSAYKNAEKIVNLKIDLGEYAKDLSDEDLLNENKIARMKLQKDNDELRAELADLEKTKPVKKEKKTEKVEAKEKKEKVEAKTGTETVIASKGRDMVREFLNIKFQDILK